MLCNIKPVPFHESDKHIFAKIPGGGGGGGGGGVRTPGSPPPSGSAHGLNYSLSFFKGWFHLRSFYSVQNASCSFTYRLYRSVKT